MSRKGYVLVVSGVQPVGFYVLGQLIPCPSRIKMGDFSTNRSSTNKAMNMNKTFKKIFD